MTVPWSVWDVLPCLVLSCLCGQHVDLLVAGISWVLRLGVEHGGTMGRRGLGVASFNGYLRGEKAASLWNTVCKSDLSWPCTSRKLQQASVCPRTETCVLTWALLGVTKPETEPPTDQ